MARDGGPVKRLLCLLLLASGVAAAATRSGDLDPEQFAYQQRAGAMLPAQLALRDADGLTVHLGNLAHGVPLIVVPAYLHCMNLCGVVRANLLGTLRRTGLAAGRDYVLVVISIDPADTSADARVAKAADLSAFGNGALREPDWHYLTGTAADIEAVTDAIGFRHRFDPGSGQFIHPAGIVFVTASGIVSTYLLGVGYPPLAVRAALEAASMGTHCRGGRAALAHLFSFRSDNGTLLGRHTESTAPGSRPDRYHHRGHRVHTLPPRANRMTWWLPEASGNAAETDRLLWALLLVSLAVLALVFGLMFRYIIKYRAGSRFDRGAAGEKSWIFEISWTAATLLIFFGFFVWGANLYVRLFQPPQGALLRSM